MFYLSYLKLYTYIYIYILNGSKLLNISTLINKFSHSQVYIYLFIYTFIHDLKKTDKKSIYGYVYHVPKCMSYHEANDVLVITGRAHFRCYIYDIYFSIKIYIIPTAYQLNTNCISIDDPSLLNKKDSQGVISNI